MNKFTKLFAIVFLVSSASAVFAMDVDNNTVSTGAGKKADGYVAPKAGDQPKPDALESNQIDESEETEPSTEPDKKDTDAKDPKKQDKEEPKKDPIFTKENAKNFAKNVVYKFPTLKVKVGEDKEVPVTWKENKGKYVLQTLLRAAPRTAVVGVFLVLAYKLVKDKCNKPADANKALEIVEVV